jgi:hypothetical protein
MQQNLDTNLVIIDFKRKHWVLVSLQFSKTLNPPIRVNPKILEPQVPILVSKNQTETRSAFWNRGFSFFKQLELNPN